MERVNIIYSLDDGGWYYQNTYTWETSDATFDTKEDAIKECTQKNYIINLIKE